MSMRKSTRLKLLEKRIKESYFIDSNTGCWIGKTEVLNNGYCRFTVYFNKNGSQKELLHKLMYERYFGKLPYGYELDHLCKNRKCCNIFHLQPVTRTENVLRSDVTKLSQDDINTVKLKVADGKSQADVAREFGIHQCHVSRIVNGKRRRYIR